MASLAMQPFPDLTSRVNLFKGNNEVLDTPMAGNSLTKNKWERKMDSGCHMSCFLAVKNTRCQVFYDVIGSF